MQMIACRNAEMSPLRLVDAMLSARRPFFVELIQRGLPNHDAQPKIQQFDEPYARYLIIMCDGKHVASARLLPTTKPHILGTLFSHLCEKLVPTGPAVNEIHRFCLDRNQPSSKRRSARDALITTLVDFAIAEAIMTYTGFATTRLFEQFSQFGWCCHALGSPHQKQPRALVPFRIVVDEHTVERTAATEIYVSDAHGASGIAA